LIAVWDLGVRLFHWLLVAAVGIDAATGLFGPLNRLGLHVTAGAIVGGLVVFRLVWGFAGATYARFSSFTFRPSTITAYVKGLQAGSHTVYLGHNRLAASWYSRSWRF
jgi:cytochrome b